MHVHSGTRARPRVDATDNMQLRAVSSTLSCPRSVRARRYLSWNACGMRGENDESMPSMPITKRYNRAHVTRLDRQRRSCKADPFSEFLRVVILA